MTGASSDIKSRLIGCCDELAAIVSEKAVEYGDSVLKDLDELKTAIRDHVFKVYLVGEFSCGKSSLLNRWLGREVLFTGLTPKTAVSTELHYADHEHMVLQSLKPMEPDEDLQGLTEANMARVHDRANAGELANVVLYMNNPRLKEYSDLCLVDLPGLSSANASHEMALNRFIQERKCVAVFCIPIGDGGVQATSLAFLRKMKSFGRQSRFKFLVTKADERTTSGQDEVMAKVRSDLSANGSGDVFVGKVSRESIGDFENLLESFQQQKNDYLLQWFGDKVRTIARGILDSLRIALSAQYDNSKIDEALERIQETETTELPSLVAEINEDMRRAAQSQVSNVLSSVRESLQGQKAALMSQAQNGGDCMSAIASVIRTTLASKAPLAVRSVLNDASQKAGDVLEEQLDFDFDVNAESAPVEPDVVSDTTQLILADAGDPIAPIRKLDHPLAKSFCMGWQIGEVGSALASILFPGSGLFMTAALGGLATLFSMGTKGPEERGRQEAEFEMKLSEACEQARPMIASAIENAISQCGEKLQAAVSDRVTSLHKQILQLKAESEAGKAEWEARQSTRQQAKARVMGILAKLEN